MGKAPIAGGTSTAETVQQRIVGCEAVGKVPAPGYTRVASRIGSLSTAPVRATAMQRKPAAFQLTLSAGRIAVPAVQGFRSSEKEGEPKTEEENALAHGTTIKGFAKTPLSLIS